MKEISEMAVSALDREVVEEEITTAGSGGSEKVTVMLNRREAINLLENELDIPRTLLIQYGTVK